jgi:hypothetical protein
MREGFALAAAAHGDRGGDLAARGLAPDVAPLAREVALRLSAADPAARKAWVRATLAAARPAPSAAPEGSPPRALALLAPHVARDLGRRWLEGAPLPRAGYVADPELLTLLLRLAASRGSA